MADPRLAPPLFIVGSGRSGTTLLRSLLSAHSRITITPETHYMKWVLKRGGFSLQGPAFASLWDDYMRTWRFETLGVEPGRCREIAEGLGGATAQNAFSAMLVAYGERAGKARVGEKSPSHTRHLDRLLAWYPEARVVVMQRDPRAVVASQLRSPWNERHITPPSLRHGLAVDSRLREVVHRADLWNQTYDRIVPAWAGDPRVLVVPYESLVRDPEREVRSVCAHLGEDYEPEMLTGRSQETVPAPAASAPDDRLAEWQRRHHAQSFRPVSADSLDKWKGELSDLEVAVTEGLCAGSMARAGYVPTASAGRRVVGRASARALVGVERAESAVRSRIRRAGRPSHSVPP